MQDNLKKTIEHESDGDTICNWYSWYNHRWIATGIRKLMNQRQVQTIQTTTLLRSARILRKILETPEDLLSLKLKGKTIS